MPGRMVSEPEQLSITTAMIGLLVVGGKTIAALGELNAVLVRSTDVITRALQEAKQCRSSVHILYKSLLLIESRRLELPERAAWIEVDDLIATLTDTVLAFSDIQGLCDEVDDMLVASRDYDGITKLYEPRLANLVARIRWHSLSMTLMMTVLRCPGLSDAENSRASLEARIHRMLNSNAELAARLRTMDRLYASRGDSVDVLVAPSEDDMQHAAVTILRSSLSRNLGMSYVPHSWSVLSGYTLADLPGLSLVPLPVDTIDVRDGSEFYTCDYARRVSRDLDELLQEQAGQGTSKTLGVILGRPIAGPELQEVKIQPPPPAAVVMPTTPPGKKKRLWR